MLPGDCPWRVRNASRGDSTSDTSQPVQGSTFRVSDREHEAMILVRFKRDEIRESVKC
jgi:hypothetical protein